MRRECQGQNGKQQLPNAKDRVDVTSTQRGQDLLREKAHHSKPHQQYACVTSCSQFVAKCCHGINRYQSQTQSPKGFTGIIAVEFCTQFVLKRRLKIP